MRRLRFLGLVVLLVAAVPALAADRWWQQVPDMYAGPIWSSGHMRAGRTEFTLTDDGRLVGSYSFVEDGGRRQHGTLGPCEPGGHRRLTCRWHDDYGDGVVRLRFSAGLERFDGGWSQSGKAVGPWRGERIPRS